MLLLLLCNLVATSIVLAFVVVKQQENDGLRDEVRFLIRRVNNMSAAFDNLKAAVTAQTAVDASAVTLIQGIADKLANMPAGTSDDDLKALADELNAAAQPLAAAVSANTAPAAPSVGTPAATPAPAATTEAPASPAAPSAAT